MNAARIGLCVVIALLTYAACDRHAGADPVPTDRCTADLSRADVSVLQARHVVNKAWTQDETAIANALLAAALEQRRTALVTCTPDVHQIILDTTSQGGVRVWSLRGAIVDAPDPYDVYGWREPIPVPGIPYLVEDVVATECPGARCPIVLVAP